MCIKAVLTCLTIKSTIRLPTQSITNLHKNLSNPFLLLQNITKRLHSIACTSNFTLKSADSSTYAVLFTFLFVQIF